MQDRGLLESTLIVFTSDHGDYLGDHWLGEKDLFHEPSVKVPLIICDPSTEADPARGTVCDDLVEAIDLLPTFLEALGADAAQQSHRLEGRSLLPFLRGQQPGRWRRYAISEYDYAMLPVAAKLGIEPRDARLFMVADRRWKLIHAPGFRPMLYDLESDPNEYRDLGADPACEGERRRLMPHSTPGACACRSARPLRATSPQPPRQVAAAGHPDRRMGRGELPERAVEQVSGRGTVR
jgi:arylsulfatase A-like enzyme